METLENKEWQPITLEEVFDIRSGKRLENRNKIKGDRPFVGATDNNNGVTGFVANENSSLDKNTLGVNYNGAPCIAFYHPYECIFTDDVKHLHFCEHKDTKEAFLAFISIFAKQKCKYNYGYKFNENRMRRQKLFVPVNKNGELDYDFMERYVSKKMKELITRYKTFLNNQLAKLEHVDVPALSEKEWKPFEVQSLFDRIESTKGKTTTQLDIGDDVPYIAASKVNNGYTCMCSSQEHPEWVSEGNAVLFVQLGDGAAGLAYYIPMDFIGMSGKTSAGYASWVNLFTGLFVAKCLSSNKAFFSHGHTWTGRRLLTTKVLLPSTPQNTPDWDYMEQYVKNMILKKYQQYLDFLEKQEMSFV